MEKYFRAKARVSVCLNSQKHTPGRSTDLFRLTCPSILATGKSIFCKFICERFYLYKKCTTDGYSYSSLTRTPRTGRGYYERGYYECPVKVLSWLDLMSSAINAIIKDRVVFRGDGDG